MYSLHGLLALIRSVFGQVCQWLIVLSNCMPGSPQTQVDSAIMSSSAAARSVSIGRPSVTAVVVHSLSSTTACMNSSVARTEWFAFW